MISIFYPRAAWKTRHNGVYYHSLVLSETLAYRRADRVSSSLAASEPTATRICPFRRWLRPYNQKIITTHSHPSPPKMKATTQCPLWRDFLLGEIPHILPRPSNDGAATLWTGNRGQLVDLGHLYQGQQWNGRRISLTPSIRTAMNGHELKSKCSMLPSFLRLVRVSSMPS